MLTTKGTKRHESESRKKNRKPEYYCDVCSNTLTSMSSLHYLHVLHGEAVFAFFREFSCFSWLKCIYLSLLVAAMPR